MTTTLSSSSMVPSTVVTPDRTATTTTSSSSTTSISHDNNNILDNNDTNHDEKTNSSQQHTTKTALEWKEEGNNAFTRKKWQKALDAYDNGLLAYQQQQREQEPSAADKAVLHSLSSNRAMALYKLEEYIAAEDCCTRLLDQHEAAKDREDYEPPSKLFKVWFRRSAARERRAKEMLLQEPSPKSNNYNPTNTNQQQQLAHDLLMQAKTDLQSTLEDLERDSRITEKERNETRSSVKQGNTRIQQLLLQAGQRNEQRQDTEESAEMLPTPTKGASAAAKKELPRAKVDAPGKTAASSPLSPRKEGPPLPSIKTQKQDVVRLFLSRQTALQKQQQQQNSQHHVAAIHGEAFFLIDWQWWRHFCHYVDLFGSHEQKVLSFMLQGASVPDPPECEDDDEDQGEDNNNNSNNVPPGPMDNNSLFFRPLLQTSERMAHDIFNEQWYPDHDDEKGQEPRLKPNLVRGYHYELVPREVYSALREWYGSDTPAICRRAERNPRTGHVSVPLYLNHHHHQEGGGSTMSKKEAPKYNLCGACQKPLTTTSRCNRCKLVHYCGRGCQEHHWPLHKHECRSLSKDKEGKNGPQKDDDRDAPRKQAPPPPIRGYPQSHGSVGLNNLGNTCFMNSAVQCLSHATPLTRYFLSGLFQNDINPHNALGTGGKLATAYETVMKDLWMRANIRSASPTALKRAIASFAPRFAGCLQHDAQEFLAYLLDGLHEDLNRIRKAPYVENPDFKEGQDMAVAGARAWAAHQRRNDSLLQDTFYGQFKSTCVCPRCNRVSVSFDAFNHVSLEIPQQRNSLVTLGVFVVKACTPEHRGSRPTQYAIQVRRNNPVSELKQELSRLTGIPAIRLALCICEDRDIAEIFRNDEMIHTIKSSDVLVAYEVEPFDGPTKTIVPYFHAIARHKTVSKNSATSEPRPVPQNDDDFLGVPLLTSWPADWTCKEIWEYLWNAVSDKVDPKVHQQYKDLVGFRVHDGRGRGLEVFPDMMENLQDGSSETVRRTSLIPRHSDQTMISFLGQGAIEDFVLMWVEWTDLEPEEKLEGPGANLKLDEDRFLAFDIDSSWREAIAKRRPQQSKGISLNECFETFTKPERLDERNTWYCSSCKEHVCALKTMELSKLPNILVVHLKRFEFRNVLRRDKLETLVDFPLEGLDMSGHCVAGQQGSVVDDHVPAVYDLFAVVNHYGRMGFGHYTAFARNWDERGITGGWQLFDDSSVGSDTEPIVSSAAYVLFYRRRTWN